MQEGFTRLLGASEIHLIEVRLRLRQVAGT